MSIAALNQLLDVQEQICYVQCSFCTTILLVNVPYSSMSMVVTVRCGHCTGLLSVNMLKASFVPLHLFSSLHHQDPQMMKQQLEVESSKALMDKHSNTMALAFSSEKDNVFNNHNGNEDDGEENHDDDDDDDITALEQIVNKPPEKKRRAPSAYNRFIKEEIRRLKARNPSMSHKEAFSTAAKNWAHFPSVQEEENSCHEMENVIHSMEEETHNPEVHLEGKRFSERKEGDERERKPSNSADDASN